MMVIPKTCIESIEVFGHTKNCYEQELHCKAKLNIQKGLCLSVMANTSFLLSTDPVQDIEFSLFGMSNSSASLRECGQIVKVNVKRAYLEYC